MTRYVVTGTDTGVGKTVVAAGLAGSLGARYWKPIQAGLDEETDSDTVRRLTEGRVHVLPEAYRLTTPCSPHEAARIDGIRIDAASLALPGGSGDDDRHPLIVEGAGGVLVPVNDEMLYADLFALWGLPIIMVARTALGTINHSLLSLEALRMRGIEVSGVIFSGDGNPAGEAAIVRFGQCRHLGRLPPLARLTPAALADAVSTNLRVDLLA